MTANQSHIRLAALWRFSLLLALACFLTMLPELAHAGVKTPMGNVLCTVVRWFTGNTGKGLATVSITVIGIAALQGKVSWGMAIVCGIGVAIIFGAGQLVNTMGAGGGSTQTCATS